MEKATGVKLCFPQWIIPLKEDAYGLTVSPTEVAQDLFPPVLS